MQSDNPRPLGLPTARNIVDGRHNRSFTGFVPTPKGGGLVPFESLLEADLVDLMVKDARIVTIHAQPETFAWRDGVHGRRRRYTPDFLAVATDGTRIYREVKPHALLIRDPDLSGRRARIEIECAARGATFEIWTEREIREDRHGCSLLRIATAVEAALHGSSPAIPEGLAGQQGAATVPGIVRRVAERLALADLRLAGDAFVARSRLTGILMTVLCDLVSDPETGMRVWKPFPRPTDRTPRVLRRR